MDIPVRIGALAKGVSCSLQALITGRIPWKIDDSVTGVTLIKALNDAVMIGASYTELGNRWAACLWEGCFVESTPEADIVRPEDPEHSLRGAVAGFRQARLAHELRVSGMRRWARMSLDEQRKAVRHLRVRSMRTGDGRGTLDLAQIDDQRANPPTGWSAQLVLDGLYPRAAQTEPIRKFGGLSVSQLVDAWDVLVPLYRVQEGFPTVEQVSTGAQFQTCAPAFRVADLQQLLVRALGFTADQAQVAIDLLTYHGRPRERISERPLIQLNDGLITLIPFTLAWANLPPVAESWLRADHTVVTRRGRESETDLRDRLLGNVQLQNAEVMRGRLVLPTSTGEEELDLVFRVGGIIVVAEAKCTVQPVTAVDRHNYASILEDAAEQALRKAQAVRDNVRAFLDRTGFQIPQESVTVLPLVVTNLAEGVGDLVGGVPVVDSLVLEEFLGPGTLRRVFGHHTDTGATVESIVPLYDSPTSAEMALSEYLRAPPELADIRRSAQHRIAPLWTSPTLTKPAFAHDVYVALPIFRLGTG
jgi:hypothetical protein